MLYSQEHYEGRLVRCDDMLNSKLIAKASFKIK